MSILDKIFSRNKQSRVNNSLYAGGTIPPSRDIPGFLKAYSEIGWLYAVVSKIGVGCGDVKWRLFRGDDRSERSQVAKHPILTILDKVNPFQTGAECIELTQIYLDLIGEAFWILNYNALDEPSEIIIPYPHNMTIVPARAFPFVKNYVYGFGADAIPFAENEVIHFKYPNPLNQYRGLGPAQAIGIDLDTEQYSNEWNRNFFFNSARPDGVIQFEYNLSDDQFEKLKKQWTEKYRGVSKAHQVALLEGGGKYIQIQNTIKDMDFYNMKLRNRDAILGVYGMPQSVMGISENVNKANAEAGDYTFARWIVKPRLDRLKNKLNEQFVPLFRKSDNLEIDYDEVVPETIEQKMLLAESGIRAGYLTINEARKLRGMDPLLTGDVLLIPLNLIPMDIKEPLEAPEPVEVPVETPVDETPEDDMTETPKSKLADGYKRMRWEHFSEKTARQELIFQKVFKSLFDAQSKRVVDEYRQTGNITVLDDDAAAKMFQPAIELVYHSSFEDAV
jgi:HK97 family phage portal protein